MKSKIKVLLTGSEGTLGQYLQYLKDLDKYDVFYGTKKTLDITSKRNISRVFAKIKPKFVIHLAAKTNVDYCEEHVDEAYRVNVAGTANIVDACKKHGSTLIFISTTAIFNGKKKGNYEDDIPDPINIYGKSKLDAEKKIQKHLHDYYIIRCGWLIGGGKREKKFISYILRQSETEKEIKVVSDKFGTITYAKELSDFIEQNLLSLKLPFGIYHFGSKGFCSRYDIARSVFRLLKQNVSLLPVLSITFNDRFFAPRPNYEVMKSNKIKFSKTWRQSLRDYISHEII